METRRQGVSRSLMAGQLAGARTAKADIPFPSGAALRRTVRYGAIAATALLFLGLLFSATQYRRARQIREALYAAFTPVTIANCELTRIGAANGGGYLMCGNLLANVEAGYSYGLTGADAWACDMAAKTRVPMHQYDCLVTTPPACAGGITTTFHRECVGPEPATIDGLPFDAMANQIKGNGHVGKRLVVKMDAEGDEWRALAVAPEHVLNAIDQMVVEFHGVESASFLETVTHLKQYFYIAHVHQNNAQCEPGFDPFPSQDFEVLFVNMRMAVANPWVDARAPSPLDAPNDPTRPDCQASPGGAEWRRVVRWAGRKLSR